MIAPTPKELRELDAELARNVMRLRQVFGIGEMTADTFFIHDDWGVLITGSRVPMHEFHPSTDPAASMEVLKKCAKKLRDEDNGAALYVAEDEPYHVVGKTDVLPDLRIQAETLELAIAKFAQQLFHK